MKPLEAELILNRAAQGDHSFTKAGRRGQAVDPANHKYGYSIATEQGAGSLIFTTKQITTAISDPTTGDRWFPAP